MSDSESVSSLIAAIRACGPRLPRVEAEVGSIAVFKAALKDYAGQSGAPRDAALPWYMGAPWFMGVPVVENPKYPADFATLKVDGVVISNMWLGRNGGGATNKAAQDEVKPL